MGKNMVKRKGVPEWSELVICEVQKITPYAAWCKLIEYPNVEGMVHVSEVAGKWVHDIRDFVKIKKQYVAKVVNIDYQKNFVNLSLKRVSKYDEKDKLNAFRREQRAEKILEQAAAQLDKKLEQAYEEVGFLIQEKFGDLFVAFDEARSNPELLEKNEIPKKWADVINKIVEKSFQEKEIVIKAELEIKSIAPDGIKIIKNLLSDLGKKTGAEIKYISAPKYRLELKAKDPKTTEKKLVEALEATFTRTKELKMEGGYKLIRD
jgi:translation initiation factor 2 subunit 1